MTFQPGSAIALNTTVTWTLNPPGATVPLRSAAGQFLATVSGSYKIASNSGGGPNEICAVPPGSYVFTKMLQYIQTSASDPILSPGNPALVSVQVQSPASGPAVTGGTFTFPGGTAKNLVSQLGFFRLTEVFMTEAAVEAAYPEGAYTLRFTQTGEPERVIPFAMSALQAVVPKIENFTEAQAIDATKDFTLRWNSFEPQGGRSRARGHHG